MFPRVLIVSHNVLSKTSNMGLALMNYFSEWPSEKLAQLYVHTEVPTCDVCKRYFRITDFDLLDLKKLPGTIFNEHDIRFELKNERVDEGMQAKVYQYGRQRKPYMYIARNMLWKLGRWKTKELVKWIDEFNPELIFYAAGDYTFSYEIAEYVAKRKRIPIVTCICDDFYFLEQKSFSPLYHLNRIKYTSYLKKFFKKNKYAITICPELSEAYEKEFGIIAETVMTTTMVEPSFMAEREEFSISYIGNLGCNRHLPLVEIGKTLQKISQGTVYLQVYSTETREEILNYMVEENGIRFCGALDSQGVKQAIENSSVLVHVESFDAFHRQRVKYSVSTKIADSLMSGRCLFAYGPEEVASMQHLIRNKCACVVTEQCMLENALQELMNNSDSRKEYTQIAKTVAAKWHNRVENAEKIRRFIVTVKG